MSGVRCVANETMEKVIDEVSEANFRGLLFWNVNHLSYRDPFNKSRDMWIRYDTIEVAEEDLAGIRDIQKYNCGLLAKLADMKILPEVLDQLVVEYATARVSSACIPMR